MSRMTKTNSPPRESTLAFVKPSKAIVNLAVPATLALLAKAVYNIVDTAYIGMLDSETALAAVGVTLPLLLIFVSIENIFAAGAAVLAGRQLGAGEAVMPLAKDYAFWMFVAALANLPAQSLNCAARAESSVKISSIAVISGATLNVILDPVCMFDWGFGMGVGGASLATTISQFVTLGILVWFYLSGRSVIKIKKKRIRPTKALFGEIIRIGVPTAVIQICLALQRSI